MSTSHHVFHCYFNKVFIKNMEIIVRNVQGKYSGPCLFVCLFISQVEVIVQLVYFSQFILLVVHA